MEQYRVVLVAGGPETKFGSGERTYKFQLTTTIYLSLNRTACTRRADAITAAFQLLNVNAVLLLVKESDRGKEIECANVFGSYTRADVPDAFYYWSNPSMLKFLHPELLQTCSLSEIAALYGIS